MTMGRPSRALYPADVTSPTGRPSRSTGSPPQGKASPLSRASMARRFRGAGARHRWRAADIGHDNGPPEPRAVPRRRHLADGPAVAQHRLAAPGEGVAVVEGEHGKAFPR